jgi:hypothetical protein
VGDLNGGLATGGGPIRGEQPGIDEPLNKALVLFVPLREPGWPAEVPRASHWACGTGLGGLHGDEAEQDALKPWLVRATLTILDRQIAAELWRSTCTPHSRHATG